MEAAVTGLVLGIAAIALCAIPCCGCYIGLLPAVLGAIFSAVGLASGRGRGVAVAGLILSTLALIWSAIWLLVLWGAFALGQAAARCVAHGHPL